MTGSQGESADNLDAMRQLADFIARDVLEGRSSTTAIRKVQRHLVVAALAVIASMILGVLAPSASSWIYRAAVVAWLVAALASRRYFSLLCELRRCGSAGV